MELGDIVPGPLRSLTFLELLASSSLGRYARYSRSAGRHSDVWNAIALHGISTEELLDLARDTWSFLADQRHRDESEADLAILLGILSGSADQRVDDFLLRVGMIDRPPLSWVSAFARSLSLQRSASVTSLRFVSQQFIQGYRIKRSVPVSSTYYIGFATVRLREGIAPVSISTSYLRAA